MERHLHRQKGTDNSKGRRVEFGCKYSGGRGEYSQRESKGPEAYREFGVVEEIVTLANVVDDDCESEEIPAQTQSPEYQTRHEAARVNGIGDAQYRQAVRGVGWQDGHAKIVTVGELAYRSSE